MAMDRSGRGCSSLIVLLALGLFALFLIPTGNDPDAMQLAQRAIQAVSDKSWERIEVREAKANNFSLSLTYRYEPGVGAPQSDTARIARAVLAELVASGRRPAQDDSTIWVWAQIPMGKGESGANLVHVFGHTEYRAESDRLIFVPWKP